MSPMPAVIRPERRLSPSRSPDDQIPTHSLWHTNHSQLIAALVQDAVSSTREPTSHLSRLPSALSQILPYVLEQFPPRDVPASRDVKGRNGDVTRCTRLEIARALLLGMNFGLIVRDARRGNKRKGRTKDGWEDEAGWMRTMVLVLAAFGHVCTEASSKTLQAIFKEDFDLDGATGVLKGSAAVSTICHIVVRSIIIVMETVVSSLSPSFAEWPQNILRKILLAIVTSDQPCSESSSVSLQILEEFTSVLLKALRYSEQGSTQGSSPLHLSLYGEILHVIPLASRSNPSEQKKLRFLSDPLLLIRYCIMPMVRASVWDERFRPRCAVALRKASALLLADAKQKDFRVPEASHHSQATSFVVDGVVEVLSIFMSALGSPARKGTEPPAHAMRPLIVSDGFVRKLSEWMRSARNPRLVQLLLMPILEQLAGIEGNWDHCGQLIDIIVQLDATFSADQSADPLAKYVLKWLMGTACVRADLLHVDAALESPSKDHHGRRQKIGKLPNAQSESMLRVFCIRYLGTIRRPYEQGRQITCCLLSLFNDNSHFIRTAVAVAISFRCLNDSPTASLQDSPHHQPNGTCIGAPHTSRNPYLFLLKCAKEACSSSSSSFQLSTEGDTFELWAISLTEHIFRKCPLLPERPDMLNAALLEMKRMLNVSGEHLEESNDTMTELTARILGAILSIWFPEGRPERTSIIARHAQDEVLGVVDAAIPFLKVVRKDSRKHIRLRCLEICRRILRDISDLPRIDAIRTIVKGSSADQHDNDIQTRLFRDAILASRATELKMHDSTDVPPDNGPSQQATTKQSHIQAAAGAHASKQKVHVNRHPQDSLNGSTSSTGSREHGRPSGNGKGRREDSSNGSDEKKLVNDFYGRLREYVEGDVIHPSRPSSQKVKSEEPQALTEDEAGVPRLHPMARATQLREEAPPHSKHAKVPSRITSKHSKKGQNDNKPNPAYSNLPLDSIDALAAEHIHQLDSHVPKKPLDATLDEDPLMHLSEIMTSDEDSGEQVAPGHFFLGRRGSSKIIAGPEAEVTPTDSGEKKRKTHSNEEGSSIRASRSRRSEDIAAKKTPSSARVAVGPPSNITRERLGSDKSRQTQPLSKGSGVKQQTDVRKQKRGSKAAQDLKMALLSQPRKKSLLENPARRLSTERRGEAALANGTVAQKKGELVVSSVRRADVPILAAKKLAQSAQDEPEKPGGTASATDSLSPLSYEDDGEPLDEHAFEQEVSEDNIQQEEFESVVQKESTAHKGQEKELGYPADSTNLHQIDNKWAPILSRHISRPVTPTGRVHSPFIQQSTPDSREDVYPTDVTSKRALGPQLRSAQTSFHSLPELPSLTSSPNFVQTYVNSTVSAFLRPCFRRGVERVLQHLVFGRPDAEAYTSEDDEMTHIPNRAPSKYKPRHKKPLHPVLRAIFNLDPTVFVDLCSSLDIPATTGTWTQALDVIHSCLSGPSNILWDLEAAVGPIDVAQGLVILRDQVLVGAMCHRKGMMQPGGLGMDPKPLGASRNGLAGSAGDLLLADAQGFLKWVQGIV
ncbi:uncharacterized protein EV422DRAFT_363286 [Fimicolochytrium jonesii]|uniref:uncharacterized protein n=1 Tax=Fimicolochytrium jonesii TaxID=1396493 RepID=UPI0022FF0703|nr:uncharacterized protein EV422DRAFT_363286 [Fimicolochytrium jonesii]KAI8823633.1 hypothetical protein EV422DRAFT_363286 [Fimicolochytrium jonesii]